MKKFTGLEYLKIDIANHFGWDKCPWNERIAWVNDIIMGIKISDNVGFEVEEALLSIVKDADDPILYTKAVRAFRDTLNGKPTGFIMGLDATASGLQIMAALIGCHTTAQNVNLINTGEREDVYQMVADGMSNILGGYQMDRAKVKKPVMTTFYGSKRQPKQLFGEDTPELKAFYTILDQELPGAMELMSDMQSLLNKNASTYSWTLPDGHVVVNTVMVPQIKRIEVAELGNKKFNFRKLVNGPNPADRSMAANIVHSIDGWIVREMYRRCNTKGIKIAAIHDSFWAHPNNMNLVRYFYKEILADIAKSNMMQDILIEITGNPSVRFTKNSYNLASHIKQSEYALS